MKTLRFIFFLLICFWLISLSSIAVFGNSAQTSFSGVDATGAIMEDEQSPIVVEKELLVFDLEDFPATYYDDNEDFLAYGGKVTANYTFYNPSEYNMTAKLLFPFGKKPQYYFDYENEIDESKYGISLDGQPIDKKMRYSFSPEYENFELDKDLGRLSNDFIFHDFYNPDLAVTKYTYSLSEVDTKTYPNAVLACDFVKKANSRIYMPNFNIYHVLDNKVRVGKWLEKNVSEITIYILGEESSLEWKFYKDGGVDDKKAINGLITLKSQQKLTLKDLIIKNLPDVSIMEVDWYNAVISKIISQEVQYGYTLVDAYLAKDDLLSWYEYEISIASKQRLVNSVTAPMFTSIEDDWRPPYYHYTYLLSPAKTWKSFDNLNIIINTSYYLSDSSLDSFKKIENGYFLSLDKLPDKELTFTLCASESPTRIQQSNSFLWVIVFLLILMVFLTVLPMVAILVILFKKRHI